jgi:hypothetical protein
MMTTLDVDFLSECRHCVAGIKRCFNQFWFSTGGMEVGRKFKSTSATHAFCMDTFGGTTDSQAWGCINKLVDYW